MSGFSKETYKIPIIPDFVDERPISNHYPNRQGNEIM